MLHKFVIAVCSQPPGTGNVQCLNGHVFCCDFGNQNPGPNPDYPGTGGGDGGGNGYATCGSRNFIDVPGKKLDYGEVRILDYKCCTSNVWLEI